MAQSQGKMSPPKRCSQQSTGRSGRGQRGQQDEGVTCGTVGANFDVSDRMRLHHL